MALVAFDFDGTLSEQEMIVELGREAGSADEIAEITEAAMAGEYSYAESLRERVALLSGSSASDVAAAYERVHLREGAANLLAALSEAGVATAVLTGGFERGVERVLEEAGAPVDRVVANRLVVDGGAPTGQVEGPLIEGTKDDALRAVADDCGVDLADVVAVGDGANDAPMLETAGTAVGFQPTEGATPYCDEVVESIPGLRQALSRLGLLAPVDGSRPDEGVGGGDAGGASSGPSPSA